MSVLPDPGASRAVLVGTSHYQHLEQLPAVSNNLQALAGLLSGPLSLQLPAQHVTVVENPDAALTVVREVRRAAAEATDTLVVYFAGHGLITQETLSLALPYTEFGRVETGLPYDWLRQVLLEDSNAERHVVILDCCYSGLALGRMSASPGLADQAAVEGSFLLAAAAETRTALAPVGDTYTAFTNALLDTLHHGIPGGPALLDLGTIYRHLHRTLEARGHPLPQARDRNSGAQVALGRNHAAGRADSESDTYMEGHTAIPKNTNLQGPSAVSPASGSAVRSGTRGRGPRIAKIVTACLALLAGGGWLIWNYDHMNQDPKAEAGEYKVEDSPTLMRAMGRADKKIIIGVKEDQPGLSETGPDGENAKGFEIDLARFLLKEIGFRGKIDFKPLVSGNRETELNNDRVDLIIASYSINATREGKVDFSVPYYKTGQSLLMRKAGEEGMVETWDEATATINNMKIESLEDLPNGTDSCTVRSTSMDFMENSAEYEEKFDVHPHGKKSSYKDCIDGLLARGEKKSYEVVSTDDVILAGLAHKYGKGNLVRPDFTFTEERYGVGMRKGDPALQYLMCRAIKKSITEKEWEAFYNRHLKDIMLGEAANPPAEPTCKGRQSAPASD